MNSNNTTRKFYDMKADDGTSAYKDIDGDWIEYYLPIPPPTAEANLLQRVCDQHERIECHYTDTAGHVEYFTQCEKCGKLLKDPVDTQHIETIEPTPSPSQEAEVRAKEDVLDIAVRIQKECHAATKFIMEKSEEITVQDATNVFIYRKLAELEYRLLNQL